MKFFVTTPIYYVNDKPHIGHVYSTVAADVIARYYRDQGRDVLFSTGTDENSQKSIEAAQAARQDVGTFIDQIAKLWQDTFTKLGFTNDVFIRTTSPEHQRAVTTLIKKIDQAGDIYEGEYTGLYCVGCEDFISSLDLVDGQCPHHKKPPQEIKEKNYFFRLSKYRQPLLDYYKNNPDFVAPDFARKQVLNYITNEMEDVSISRQSQEWGIRLPQNEKHAVYVWFDALINYLTVTGYPDKSFTHYWPADLHLIGKDIIKFHCAIWPAMLMSAGLPLPKKIFAHGFFTIDGAKISKSLSNTINPLEIIEEYPFDAIRYYLLRDIPFGNDGDFSHQRLKDRYNADLANGLGNLVSRTLNMIQQSNLNRNILTSPLGHPVGGPKTQQQLDKADQYIEQLAFDKALSSIWRTIAAADEFIEQNKPWELAKQGNTKQLQETLASLYQTLVLINDKIAPFLPTTHDKLTSLLNADPIEKPTQPLFARKP